MVNNSGMSILVIGVLPMIESCGTLHLGEHSPSANLISHQTYEIIRGKHMRTSATRTPVVRAGIVIGLGIGGFFDGIVLHQILQWHHLVSEHYPPTTLENLQVNTLADGLFHGATWIFTVLGLFMLWRVYQENHSVRATRVLVGGLLMGWGIFNLVEGIVVHHILQIHHVRTGLDQAVWDIGFLVWGALMLIIGWYMTRGSRVSQEEREIRTGT